VLAKAASAQGVSSAALVDPAVPEVALQSQFARLEDLLETLAGGLGDTFS